jgi:carboxymethylenebutenolidase
VSGGRVAHERISWDQAGALAQVGALDPAGLPITGAEQAGKGRDRSLAHNAVIGGWETGCGL